MSGLTFPFSSPFTFEVSAPLEAVVDVDHVAIALARLCKQFRSDDPLHDPTKRTNMEKLVIALAEPANDLELALQQLRQLRAIGTGSGVTLDAIGNLVGQERGTLIDDDYRRFLFARIATNRSAGKRRDLIKISRLILDSDTVAVEVRSESIATAVVRIRNLLVPNALADTLFTFLASAVDAGVRLILETGASDFAGLFRFDAGPGFDIGQFADSRG